MIDMLVDEGAISDFEFARERGFLAYSLSIMQYKTKIYGKVGASVAMLVGVLFGVLLDSPYALSTLCLAVVLNMVWHTAGGVLTLKINSERQQS